MFNLIMAQTLSIKETRNKLADIINQVAVAGDVFVITKFGQPKAMIVPISEQSQKNRSSLEISFGVWAKRSDLRDSSKWVASLRSKMSKRDE